MKNLGVMFALLLSLPAWATEPEADYNIAKQMAAKTYQQTWVGEEMGETYYLDSKVAIDQHRFYIRSDGFGPIISLVSCAPKARYRSVILVQTGKQTDEYPNDATRFEGQDFQEFVKSFASNPDLKKLCGSGQ